VGGASRGERRRRQGARPAQPPAAPPPGRDKRVKVGVIVASVIAVLIAGTLLLPLLWPDDAPVAAAYPVAAEGTVVTAGQGSAPVTVAVYEDYLCPVCERFENRYGDEIKTALNEGRVKVEYHSTAILDNRSDPPGYSTLAANAALCAVPAGIWPAFHERLYAEQPAEGGPGLTAAQLAAIGTELGAGPEFAQCVEANGNAAAIAAATEAAAADPALQTDGQFGTPTVAVDGRKVDVSNPDWLKDATGQ
jgi:protein-disulfide isomerase